MTYYTYGMRLRPAGPGCQPKDIAVICSGNRRYRNILMYSRKLTDEEERSYEPDYLGEQSLGDKIDGRTE